MIANEHNQYILLLQHNVEHHSIQRLSCHDVHQSNGYVHSPGHILVALDNWPLFLNIKLLVIKHIKHDVQIQEVKDPGCLKFYFDSFPITAFLFCVNSFK